MKMLPTVLKKNRTAIGIYLLFSLTCFAVFRLYGISPEPLHYACALGLFALLCLIIADLVRERRRAAERSRLDWRALPPAHSPAEEDYQEALRLLGRKLEEAVETFNEQRQDSLDYYTAWVHQIKTPIAVMRLKLAEDTPQNRALSAELFRIEQYVDMVLQYIRLGSESNDLVIREYDLDDLICEAIRKYAPQFVEKKLRLSYVHSSRKYVTDRKWFVCILEQLLSNAVKYTPSGTVSVEEQGDMLIIADTGIGIAPEDLPRIFEKGYTGLNGRTGQKSSGLGLYLAKRAADLLQIPIRVESTPGKGSSFFLDLHQDQ